MTSPSWTWVICLNRRCRWTNCHFSGNNGRPRSSGIWCGCSKTWIRCARKPRNGSVIPGRQIPIVINELNAICIVMWLRITCGGAWCPGARRGRARHRISWIMFGGRMMYHGTLNQPVWRTSFPVDSSAQGLVGFAHGQSFRDINGRSPVQRHQPFADSSLSGTQARAPAYCLQEGLSDSSASVYVTGGVPVSV